MTLQLARLVERVNRNFEDRRVTGVVSWVSLKTSTPFRSKVLFASLLS
jgi:hypothetical protein